MTEMTVRAADVRVDDEMWNSSAVITSWRWVRVTQVQPIKRFVMAEGGKQVLVGGIAIITVAWSTWKMCDEAVAIRRPDQVV